MEEPRWWCCVEKGESDGGRVDDGLTIDLEAAIGGREEKCFLINKSDNDCTFEVDGA